jgi:hypothetical protein
LFQALRIAARNAKNVRFDTKRESEKQSMVREVPDYAQQYLIEHPEFGPPLNPSGAGAPAREPATSSVVQIEAQADPQAAERSVSQKSTVAEPAAKRRKNTAHGASRGTEAQNNPAPKERKKPRHESVDHDDPKEYERIQQAQAAIPGALAGNWRDLRTVFEFAGLFNQNKEASSS